MISPMTPIFIFEVCKLLIVSSLFLIYVILSSSNLLFKINLLSIVISKILFSSLGLCSFFVSLRISNYLIGIF